MAGPTQVPDRKVYRGDPYRLRFRFKNPDLTPRDVSGAEWTITSPLDFSPDLTQANAGIVDFTASGGSTGSQVPPYVRWDLFEANIWGRTILAGRLEMVEDA